MTLQEFKHWFDGVVFAIGDRPSKEQWQMIKEQFDKIESEVSVQHVHSINNHQNHVI